MKPLVLLCTLAAIAACNSDAVAAPQGLPFAMATNGCGPDDAPSLAIYLSGKRIESLQPATPYLRVVVWHAANELPGQVWTLGQSDAGAWYQWTPQNSEYATGGTLQVTSVEADRSIHGTVDITFRGAGRVVGGFEARWIPTSALCG